MAPPLQARCAVVSVCLLPQTTYIALLWSLRSREQASLELIRALSEAEGCFLDCVLLTEAVALDAKQRAPIHTWRAVRLTTTSNPCPPSQPFNMTKFRRSTLMDVHCSVRWSWR